MREKSTTEQEFIYHEYWMVQAIYSDLHFSNYPENNKDKRQMNNFQNLLSNTKSEKYWFLKKIIFISNYKNSYFVFNISLKILHSTKILLT